MRKTPARITLALVVTCLGCGASTEEDRSAEDVAREIELASCERRVECGRTPDLATCLAVTDDAPIDDDFSYATVIAGVQAGRIVLDQDAATRCIAAVREMPCDSDAAAAPTEAACGDLFGGTVAEAGVCFTHLDCTSRHCEGLLCGEACCQGVCGAPWPAVRVVGAGEDCGLDDTVCGEGLFCRYEGEVFGASCVPQGTAGEACDWDDECVEGLACVGSGTVHATCGQAPRTTEPCDPDAHSDCADSTRDFCDPVAHVCAPRKALGEACSVVEGRFDEGCPRHGWCVAGTCVLRPLEGEPCGEVACLGDLPCRDEDICGPAESFGVGCE